MRCTLLSTELYSALYVTLSVKARPQFFDEKHFVNEVVKFPVAFLENAKLALIQKIFVTVRF